MTANDRALQRVSRLYRDPDDLVGEEKELYEALEKCQAVAKRLGIEELSFNLEIDKRFLLSHGTARITTMQSVDFSQPN